MNVVKIIDENFKVVQTFGPDHIKISSINILAKYGVEMGHFSKRWVGPNPEKG